jgi:hypothetical protein
MSPHPGVKHWQVNLHVLAEFILEDGFPSKMGN